MNEYYGLVEQIAPLHGLDPILVGCMITHESNWNTWAVRFEPQWSYLLQPQDYASKLLITSQTETQCQKMSWGLGQIMGSVARELGYQGHLTQLCVPSINIELMCKKLQSLFQRYGVEEDVVAAYNLGSPRKTPGGLYENQKNYVDPIFRLIRAYRG